MSKTRTSSFLRWDLNMSNASARSLLAMSVPEEESCDNPAYAPPWSHICRQ